MSTKVYNWGILGCGRISNDFALCLDIHPRSKIVGCAARKLSNAKEFAKKFDISTYYGSYSQLANDSNIDIIYIGTIHPSHKQNVIMCLNNGKHVICEKPIGLNSGELNEMLLAAKRNNRFFVEAMWTRFFPSVKQVKQWINGGEIGDLISYTSSFCVNFNGPPGRLWDVKLGGGVLLDIGVYTVHWLPLLFGNKLPKKLTCTGVVDKIYNIDTIVSTTCLYNNKQYAMIHSNMFSKGFDEYCINGTKGRIKLFSHAPTKIILEKFGTGNNKRSIISKLTKEYPLPKGFRNSFIFPASEGLIYEINEVIKCLDEGRIESPNYTWNEMKCVMQIMDECRLQIGLKYESDKRYPLVSKL